MENKKAFILYKYDNFKNDYEYIREYYNLKELQEQERITLQNKKSIYQFIYNKIDNNIKHLLKDKYIIIKEVIR